MQRSRPTPTTTKSTSCLSHLCTGTPNAAALTILELPRLVQSTWLGKGPATAAQSARGFKI